MYDEWAGGGFSVRIKNTKCVFVYCLVADSGVGIWPARAQPGRPIPASSSVIARSYLPTPAGRCGGSERNLRAVLVWSRAPMASTTATTTLDGPTNYCDQSPVWCVPTWSCARRRSSFFRVSKSSGACCAMSRWVWPLCVSFETTASTASLRHHFSPVIPVDENGRRPFANASALVGHRVRGPWWFCGVLRRQFVPRSRRRTAAVLRRPVHQGTEHRRVRAPQLIQDASLLWREVPQSRMVSMCLNI